MNSSTQRKNGQLTDYEAEQVCQIAAWKAQHANPFAEAFKSITLPAAKVVEAVIPNSLVQYAIEKAYDLAEFTAAQEDLKAQAGVSDLRDLRHKPLEECDRLATQVSLLWQAVAVIEGAATGAGGIWTTALDVPVLFALAMRTILKVGHCYGYPLDNERDRKYVLGILVVGSSSSRETKLERLGNLRDVEDWLLEETQENILTEEAASILFQLEVFEDVPGIGAFTGGLFNLAFLHKINVTAQRVFQERWLRDNGKVDWIEPGPFLERHGTHLVSRAAYTSCYYLGYGVSLPAFALAAAVAPWAGPLVRGAREGAAAATNRVERLRALTSNGWAPQGEPVPSLA